MLLYGQLNEGLSYILIKSPAVSGALNYKELCLAAKRVEIRLAELKTKQQLKDNKLVIMPTDHPYQHRDGLYHSEEP